MTDYAPRCMSKIPPLAKPKMIPGVSGFPTAAVPRCGQTVGVTVWGGSCGQLMAACALPLHREDVQSQDAPYRATAEFGERVRHEIEEDARGQL